MILIMGVSLYTSRVVLAVLGVEDYGIYGVVSGIVTMFIFLNGALSSATSRFFTIELGRNDHEQLRNVFSCALLAHIAIAVIIFILSETVGLWFLQNKMVIPAERMSAAHWVYQLSILACMFSITQVPYNAVIIAHEKMQIYAYVSMADAILRLLAVYLLSVADFDKLIFYAFAMLVVQVSVMIFYRFYCTFHHQECRFHLYKNKMLYRKMLSYSAFNLIGGISGLAQGQGLNLLLNLFFGAAVNAARSVAYQVQGAITQFSNSFMTAVRPQIIKLYAQGKKKEMMALVKNSSIMSFLLVYTLSLPVILEMDYVLTLWLVRYPAYTVSFATMVLINSIMWSMRLPRITVFHATGFVKASNLITGTILCMAFPLGYAFLKAGYGPNSVFWGMLITTVVTEFSNLMILKRCIKYSIRDFVIKVHGKCLMVLFISLIIPLLLHYKLSSGLERTMLVTVGSTISIAFSAYFMALTKHQQVKIRHNMKIMYKKWIR
jgi:O-antigen/teichoic acid export membrane protein